MTPTLVQRSAHLAILAAFAVAAPQEVAAAARSEVRVLQSSQPYYSKQLPFHLIVPAGVALRVEPLASPKGPGQMQELLWFERPQAAAIRLEVYSAPTSTDVATWYRQQWQFVQEPTTTVRGIRFGRAGVPALQVVVPPSKHALPQEMWFAVQGPLRVRLVSDDRLDPQSLLLMAAIAASFDATVGQHGSSGPRGGRK